MANYTFIIYERTPDVKMRRSQRLKSGRGVPGLVLLNRRERSFGKPCDKDSNSFVTVDVQLRPPLWGVAKVIIAIIISTLHTVL